ncbi:interferon-inducible GTPase 5-like [Mercenaria mercenaria]|uniref:interferon-inducible GTPase 5-like n=1 Tax=Mercenaria mercenaria TaxID=6596 RepID=UPI001E1D50E0|nr:interferon-inducible GTPase 5-like [Mercenaria mercenaria]
MVLGVAGISKKAVQEKVMALKSRSWKIALMSGAGAAIPIPFVSSGIDASIILGEVLFYRSQFALDDSSLSKLADIANITLEELKSILDLQTPGEYFTSAGIKQFLGTYAAAGAAEKLVQYSLPIVGTVIGCGASYGATYHVLNNILNEMTKDAFKVLQFIAEKINNAAA